MDLFNCTDNFVIIINRLKIIEKKKLRPNKNKRATAINIQQNIIIKIIQKGKKKTFIRDMRFNVQFMKFY